MMQNEKMILYLNVYVEKFQKEILYIKKVVQKKSNAISHKCKRSPLISEVSFLMML